MSAFKPPIVNIWVVEKNGVFVHLDVKTGKLRQYFADFHDLKPGQGALVELTTSSANHVDLWLLYRHCLLPNCAGWTGVVHVYSSRLRATKAISNIACHQAGRPPSYQDYPELNSDYYTLRLGRAGV